MDLTRAFSFVFDDDQWIPTILIGGLLLLVPLLGPIMLIGFMFETARNVAAGNPRPLPRWDRFGEKFMDGLYGIVIQLVYSLPLIVFACILSCVALFGVAAGRSEEGFAVLLIGATLCLTPIIIIVSLVLQPIMLAAFVRYLQTGSLSMALQVGEVVRLTRSNLSAWFVLWLLQLLCGVIGSLGSVALVIGVFFTMFYSQIVFGHLLGQTLRDMGQPAMPASPYEPPPPMSYS